jgi:SAM-dependent methyltransferase
MSELALEIDNGSTWTPNLAGERVVEGIHYGWLMRDHLARYQFATKYCRRRRVLDLATGTGYGASILRKYGAREVVGVDCDPGVLSYAKERYGTFGLDWVRADAYELPFEAEFDVVVSFETIEHLKDPERFVAQCRKALKPGGLFIVSTPESAGGPMCSAFHEFEFTRNEFAELLETNFSHFELFGQRRELAEAIRPFGNLPQRYWDANVRSKRYSHTLYTLMDRLNKLPSHLLAWASGLGESYRQRIVPIDEPIRYSPLLKENYFAMIGVCRTDAMAASAKRTTTSPMPRAS